MNRLIGGWALSGIWSYSSGSPFSILTGANGTGWGTFNRDARSTYNPPYGVRLAPLKSYESPT
jgi:hypothetical protein